MKHVNTFAIGVRYIVPENQPKSSSFHVS